VTQYEQFTAANISRRKRCSYPKKSSICATTSTTPGQGLQSAAYVLWRLNWIHPFADGNGRTARAVSYVVMSAKLDSLLPGAPTIPEQIAGNKKPYYDALETADLRLTGGEIDVSALEDMLDRMLATQLLSAAKEAKGEAKSPSSRTYH
jgi:Fic family protein